MSTSSNFKDCENFINKANAEHRPYIVATTVGKPPTENEAGTAYIEICIGNFENVSSDVIGGIFSVLMKYFDIDFMDLITLIEMSEKKNKQSITNHNISLN